MIYMGPEPWYLRLMDIPGELWSELKIELVVHHLPVALAWVIVAAFVATILGIAIAVVMKR